MNVEQIRQTFISSDSEHLIVLDWDADILPFLQNGSAVSFNTLQDDEIETVMKSLIMLPCINNATEIVFNLSVREQYCCKTWQISLISNTLCSIPSQPSIVWSYTKSSSQSANIKISILYY